MVELRMPNGDVLEFPDGTNPDVMQSAGKRYMTELAGEMATQGMSGLEKFAAGAGQRIANWGRGLGQTVGLVSREDIDAAKARDTALMSTGAARAGDIATSLAVGTLGMGVPGALTIPGAAITGGLFGLAEQAGTDDSKLLNTAIGAGAGAAGQKVANVIGSRLGGRYGQRWMDAHDAELLNAPKDTALAAGRQAGLVINPAQSNRAGMLEAHVQGMAGKHRIDQVVSRRNQPVVNQLIKEELGEGANPGPVSHAMVDRAISRAYRSGYQPVKMFGRMTFTPQYDAARRQILADAAINNADDAVVRNLANRTDVVATNGRDLLANLREIRRLSSNYYSQFARDRSQAAQAAGKAHWDMAEAIEQLIEDNARHKGRAALIPALRASRAQIAKAHDVERALTEATGNVDPREFAKMLDRGAPLTGNLNLLGRFSTNFPDAVKAIESGGASATPTRVDYLASMMGAGLGLGAGGAAGDLPGAGAGGALGGVLGFLAPQATRSAALRTALSRAMQNRAATPAYGPGLLETAGFRALPYARRALGAPAAAYAGLGLIPNFTQ